MPAATAEMNTASSNAELVSAVSIEPIGMKPLNSHRILFRIPVPVSTKLRRQSARGLEVHFLIKGAQFEADDVDGFGVAPSAPIPLTALLPNGSTRTDAATGKKVPEVEATPFRIRCQFTSGKAATKSGVWYPPVLAPQMAKTTAESGQLRGFDGCAQSRTQSRKAQRKNKMTTAAPPGLPSASGVKRAGSRSASADSGHESDDSHESERSKLARGLGRLGQPGSPSGQGANNPFAPLYYYKH